MYNIDFLPQLETSRRHLFRISNMDDKTMPYRYSPPLGVNILQCEEGSNGEWVPKRALENRTESIK